MQIDEKLIDGLTKIGLQRYQAQVYIASIALGEATAYLIAKESGVPRAKVYSVLDSLVELGFIVKAPAEKGMLFTALPPEDTIDSTLDSIVSIIDNVKLGIKNLKQKQSSESSDSPVMIFNNVNSLIAMLKIGDFPEAWIDNKLEISSQLREILYEKKCKIHTISSTIPLAFILGITEALFIKGKNGTQTMIKFSDRILQELLDLTKELPTLEARAKETSSVRIISETSLMSLEDRIKTIIPGFDLKTEKVLFWGMIDKVNGAFEKNNPSDCFITESRLLIGADDGDVWARALKFVKSINLKKEQVSIIFHRVDGSEQLTIFSDSYCNIIANLVAFINVNS
ncbi:MAG: TrmB family transcriptional regulator [Candidatus Thorarchaeota archaeon]